MSKQKGEPAKRGRPTVYDPIAVERILERIAKGESLKSICRDESMPSDSAFRAWVIDDVDGVAARSARAYDIGHDAIADDCIEIADTEEDVARAKIRIDTRIRLLAKWSKKYGDKLDVNHGGAIEHDASKMLGELGSLLEAAMKAGQ